MDHAHVAEWVAGLRGTTVGALADPPSMLRRRYSSSSNEGDSEWSSSSDDNDTQLIHRLTRDGERQEGSLGETNKELPEWFHPGPFLYNLQTCLISLPGLFLALSICGDLLLYVVLIGGLMIYIFIANEKDGRAIFACTVTFICCQCVVMFSAFPLLWESLWNMLLLMLINMFSVITGAWAIVQFQKFRSAEPELAKGIETLLFSLYVFINLSILAWIIATLTSISVVPFVFVIVGFGVFQIVLKPVPSSFSKQNEHNSPELVTVLDDATHLLVLVFFCVAPPVFSLFIDVIRLSWGILTLQAWIKFAFFIGSTVFLATYLHSRNILEKQGLPEVLFERVRLISGLEVLILTGPIVEMFHGSGSRLLWMVPFGVLLWATFAYILSHKNKRAAIVIAFILCLFHGYCIFQFPLLHLDYHLIGGSMHVSTFCLITYGISCYGILCVYLATFANKEEFGIHLLIFTVGITFCMKVLTHKALLSSPLMALTCALWIYVLLRLRYTEKLPRSLAWLSISIVSSCAVEIFSIITYPNDPEHMKATHGMHTVLFIYLHIAFFLLTLTVIWILVFENSRDMSLVKAVSYWLLLLVMNLLNVPLQVQVWKVLLGTKPSPADCLAVIQIVSGAVFSRLGWTNQNQEKVITYGGPLSITTGVFVLLLQPPVDFSLDAVITWVFLGTVVTCLLLPYVVKHLNTPRALAIFSTSVGFGVGAKLSQMIQLTSGLSVAAVLVISSVSTMAAVFAWQIPHILVTYILHLLLISVISCAILFNDNPALAMLAAITALLIIAAACKYLAVSGELLVADLTSKESPKRTNQRVPLIGNLCTISACGLLMYWCPIESPELWVPCCSLVLFLLQQDCLLLRGVTKSNQLVPSVTLSLLNLISYSIAHSVTWTTKYTFTYIGGVIEICLIIITLPVYFVLLTVLWGNVFIISDRTVVFLAPVNLCLLYVGSTYTVWVLAAAGMCISTWLIVKKLPLKLDYDVR